LPREPRGFGLNGRPLLEIVRKLSRSFLSFVVVTVVANALPIIVRALAHRVDGARQRKANQGPSESGIQGALRLQLSAEDCSNVRFPLRGQPEQAW